MSKGKNKIKFRSYMYRFINTKLYVWYSYMYNYYLKTLQRQTTSCVMTKKVNNYKCIIS